MHESDKSDKVEMTVIAQIPDLQDGDEVLISAFDRKLSLIAAGTPLPYVPDTFIFRLTIPVFASFQLHLYTRCQPSQTDAGSLPPVDRDLGFLSKRQAGAEAKHPAAEEAANRSPVRINRAEWYGHLVVATPDWKTVFISWGDVFSNWMENPRATEPAQLTLLMMVRCQKDQPKQRLRLRLLKLSCYDEDDDDEGEEDGGRGGGGGGGGAREISSSEKEFPLGSGCYWIRGPKEIARNPYKFCLQVIDKNKRKSVHRELRVNWSELPVGEGAFQSCVVCCELLSNDGPVPVPRLSTRATVRSATDLATDQFSSESHSTLAYGMLVSATNTRCVDF